MNGIQGRQRGVSEYHRSCSTISLVTFKLGTLLISEEVESRMSVLVSASVSGSEFHHTASHHTASHHTASHHTASHHTASHHTVSIIQIDSQSLKIQLMIQKVTEKERKE